MIRQGTIADMDRILGIERASQPCPWSETQIRGEIENASFFVQADGPDPGGFVFFKVAADEMEITNIAVVPGKQRQGIGRSLLVHAMAEGRKKGAVRAFLEVRTGNREARPLYESLGFKTLSVRKAYYGEGQDALVMGREL